MASRTLATSLKSRSLFRQSGSLTTALQRYTDISLVCGLLYLLVVWKTGSFPAEYQLLGLLTMVMMVAVYHISGVYKPADSYFRSGSKIVLAWLTVCCLLVVVGAATKHTELYSRVVFFSWVGVGLIAQVGTFLLFTYFSANKHRIARTQVRTLVVGTGESALRFAALLKTQRGLEDKILGSVSVDKLSEDIPGVLGDLSEIDLLIKNLDIQRVYISLPYELSGKVHEIQETLSARNVDVFWTPDISSFQLVNHSVKNIAGTPVFALSESPVTASRVEYMVKAIFDRVVAAVLIVLLSPVMLAAAVAVKLSSPGKLIYTQKRHGINGKIINIRKFRSMYEGNGAGQSKTAQATQGDARITPVGRFIRRTSIDELPQLFNVLDGSMSLVGPRPHALDHNEQYEKLIRQYNNRNRTKPGITGLAQISGFRGETDTIEKMEGRVEMDIRYINNWSLMMDISILLKTPVSLVLHKAY